MLLLSVILHICDCISASWRIPCPTWSPSRCCYAYPVSCVWYFPDLPPPFWKNYISCFLPMLSIPSAYMVAQKSFNWLVKLTLPYFLPSPRRYSSWWALASWIISLHFSLLFICSDDEASNGRMKKWEECGWKWSWPTYFRRFSIHSIHPRLIIWFLNNLVFMVWGC
jgi:hypothetical protein